MDTRGEHENSMFINIRSMQSFNFIRVLCKNGGNF